MALASRSPLRRWWRQRLGPPLARARAWLATDASGTGLGLPRAFMAFLVIFGVGMILVSLVGDQGWIAYLRLQGERGQLRQRIEETRAREAQLRREIHALQDDPAYLEQVARKLLGLVKPGDVVIEMRPKRKSHP
ncbi:MAG: septum formation initiator family protein [Candidatus Lambdaproteobacteria bacterium]|nr:septum formation initiator family protein [Candidatus Lambdaproteobacteria bacterium]